MIVPDVNVLVHLHRREHPHHAAAQDWWLGFSEGGEPLTVPDLIWVGFVRIVTNRRIFRAASTPEEAWQFVDALRAQGIYIEYANHPRLLEEFGARLRETNAAADLVTDAYIASATASLGATLVTFDRDFRRFDGLSLYELG